MITYTQSERSNPQRNSNEWRYMIGLSEFLKYSGKVCTYTYESENLIQFFSFTVWPYMKKGKFSVTTYQGGIGEKRKIIDWYVQLVQHVYLKFSCRPSAGWAARLTLSSPEIQLLRAADTVVLRRWLLNRTDCFGVNVDIHTGAVVEFGGWRAASPWWNAAEHGFSCKDPGGRRRYMVITAIRNGAKTVIQILPIDPKLLKTRRYLHRAPSCGNVCLHETCAFMIKAVVLTL